MNFFRVVFLIFILNTFCFASKKIDINFKDLEIMELVKITSKIIDKNILLTENIKGTVDFISNETLNKKQLVKILSYSLESKGFTLVDDGNILRVVQITEETKNNLYSQITSNTKKSVEIIELKNINILDAIKNLDAVVKSVFKQTIQAQKISLIPNLSANSLTIVASKKNIKYLKKYIKDIDKKDVPIDKVVEVIPLKNTEAKNIIKIIDSIIEKEKSKEQKLKVLTSLDEDSNSIVLIADIKQLESFKLLIKQLDKEKAQVYVQARIIEVTNSLVDEVGIKYGILGGSSKNKGLSTFASSLNGGNALSFAPSSIGLSIPTISAGIALGASISLLDQDGALNIVSEPSILAINNKESSIYVGQTISVKTSSSLSDGGTKNENFKREDIGLTLKVKPRISNDNKVTLEINTILEDVKTTLTNSGNADTTKKEIITTAIVKNGESVILGGLVEDKEESIESKVPGVSEVPVLGKLFTHERNDTRKRSLVIIVTPYIIPKSKDLTFVRNELAQLKFLEDRYLQESLIKLKQKQIEKLENKKKYEDKLVQLENKYQEVKKKKSINKSEEIDKRSAHEKRVAEILGN